MRPEAAEAEDETERPEATDRLPYSERAQRAWGDIDKPGEAESVDRADRGPQNPDHRELTVAQAEFVGSEIRTPAGSAFFYPDDARYRQSTDDVPEFPGEYVLDCHGTPDSVELWDTEDNLHQLNPSEFAQVVRQSTGWTEGTPIRLFACYTGHDADGFAQQLADELQTEVRAPTTPVGPRTDSEGTPSEPVLEGRELAWDEVEEEFVPVIVRGEWMTFLPH